MKPEKVANLITCLVLGMAIGWLFTDIMNVDRRVDALRSSVNKLEGEVKMILNPPPPMPPPVPPPLPEK